MAPLSLSLISSYFPTEKHFRMRVITAVKIRNLSLRVSLAAAMIAPSAFCGDSIKYPKLSREGLQELRELSEKIVAACPKSECLPVFLGRSSSLIAAYMEANHQIEAIFLPASGLSSISESSLAEAQQKFSDYVLEPYLHPRLKDATFKRVMVIDYVNQGNSIARAGEWVEEFLNNKFPKTFDTQLFSFGGSLKSLVVQRLESKGISVKSVSIGSNQEGHLQYLIHQSMVENYAPIDFWNPLSEGSTPSVNRALRKPYKYIDGKDTPTAFASFNDLVEWFGDRGLSEKLKTTWQIRCENSTHHAGQYTNFIN